MLDGRIRIVQTRRAFSVSIGKLKVLARTYLSEPYMREWIGMFRMIIRTFGVAVSAMLLMVGVVPAANAANLKVSNGNGYVEHIDDGDKFKVCDTRVNDKGVTGMLIFNGSIIAAEDDGGDAGCDYFTFNVVTGFVYELKICDRGYRNCDSRTLVE